MLVGTGAAAHGQLIQERGMPAPAEPERAALVARVVPNGARIDAAHGEHPVASLVVAMPIITRLTPLCNPLAPPADSSPLRR